MKLFLLMVLVMCTGWATAQDGARYSAYMACLAQKFPDVDDGISDAATVGRSLRGACLVEFNSMMNELSKKMTIGELQSLDTRAATIQTESTIRAVLTNRVAQKKAREQESRRQQ
jgi:hypothetical protein